MADEMKTGSATGDAAGGGDGGWGADQITLMVVGAGQRGKIYARYAYEYPERVKIVAVAEPRAFHRGLVQKRYGVDPKMCFSSWEEAAAQPKLADGVIIATQDALHKAPAVAFARLGYHILLEKPMAVTVKDCCEIVAAVKRAGVILAVGHVLRYMPYSRLIRHLVTSGAIGDVVNCQHIEPIGYWHFAHSYTRGNWRREDQSTFMLMAKCCHDVDVMRFYMNDSFDKVSSFGSLKTFRKDQKPKEAGDAKRCLDCSIKGTCPYSATKVYLDSVQRADTGWPASVLVDDEPTVENISEALRTGPYGRCAWECDNDVLDNQVVNFQFKDGKTANLTTVAFTKDICKRHTRIFGTLGELEGDGDAVVKHTNFRTGVTRVLVADSPPEGTHLQGHNGADFFLIQGFVRAVATGDRSHVLSGPDETLESHLAVFAAEHARKTGTVVDVGQFIREHMADLGDGEACATGTGSGTGDACVGAGAGSGAGAAPKEADGEGDVDMTSA